MNKQYQYQQCYFGCQFKGQLHCFPRVHLTDKFQKWKLVLRKEDQKRKDSYIRTMFRFCDNHFTENYKTNRGGLVFSAVPELNLGRAATESPEHFSKQLDLENEEPTIDILEQPEPDKLCLDKDPFFEDDPLQDAMLCDVLSDNWSHEDPLETLDKIEDLSQFCRVCLAADCEKMYSLKKGIVSKAYDQIVGKKNLLGLSHVCWECGARLLAALRLRETAERAHEQLVRLLAEHDKITAQDICSVDREKYEMTSNLGNVTFDVIDIPAIEISNISSFDNSKEDIQKHNIMQAIQKPNLIKPEPIFDGETQPDNENFKPKNEKFETDIENLKLIKTDKNKLTYTVIGKNCERIQDRLKQHPLLEVFKIRVLDLAEQKEKYSAFVKSQQHKKFRCPICSKGFNYVDNKRHHLNLHAPDRGDHVCNICKIRFKFPESLRLHSQSHSLEYVCKMCELTTRTKSVALKHLSDHDIAMFCPVCEKGFHQYDELQDHLSSHFSKRFPCEQDPLCHRSSKQSKVQQVKLMMVYCDQCCRYFATQEGLRAHQKRLHAMNSVNEPKRAKSKKYLISKKSKRISQRVCDQCQAVLRNKKEFGIHWRQNHPNLPNPLLPNYMCEKCGIILKKSGLYHHSLTHAAPRFICDICRRTFKRKQKLKSHLARHINKKKLVLYQSLLI